MKKLSVDENLNITHESYFDVVHSGKGLVKNLYKSTYLGLTNIYF